VLGGPLTCAISLLLGAGDVYAPWAVPRELEFPFDDAHLLFQGQSNGGKLFRTHGLPTDGTAVPLVVFIHGMTIDGALHHWLTPDPNGPWDARAFMGAMVDEGKVAPHVVAAPSQTLDADNPEKLFVGLDFDAFVAAVDLALAPVQKVDRTKVFVLGNSAGACYPGAASFRALEAKTFTPFALFAVDGCMSKEGGELLAKTTTVKNVIVTYQDWAWTERSFEEFRWAWASNVALGEKAGQRILEKHGFSSENLHLELVEFTMRRFMPKLLPPP